MSTRRTTQDEYAAVIEEDTRGQLRPVPGTATLSEDYAKVKGGREVPPENGAEQAE